MDKSLARLDPEIINSQNVIKLKEGVGLSKSFWLHLKSSSGSVEGKLHLTNKNTSRIIIFEPGFPGDGSTRLERLWLKDILENNFDVFATRHNGTIINGKYSDNYLNCKEKQQRAEKENEVTMIR